MEQGEGLLSWKHLLAVAGHMAGQRSAPVFGNFVMQFALLVPG